MPVIHSERDPSRAEENPPPVASFSADSSPCTVGGIMFFNSLTQVGSHTHIVASVGAFQDIAGPALRLAHQGFARSGHSAQGGMAERVGFELEPGCAREPSGSAQAKSRASPASRGTGSKTWRRGWDSNPRLSFPNTRFPSVLLKPLGHLSA